jgi:general secretion pathway protein D
MAAGAASAAAALALSCLPALAQQGQPPSQPAGGVVNFSFDAVDVGAFIKLVGEMTGKQFVVGEGVKGKITVVAPRVSREQVYPLFISILESAGCSVVQDGSLYRVVQMAPRSVPVAPVVPPETELPSSGMVTRIIRLRNVSADSIVRALQSTVGGGKDVGIAAIEETNHILVTDTADSVRRLEKIVGEIDKPGMAKTSELVPLKFASADEIADQLNEAFLDLDTRIAVQRRVPRTTRVGEPARGGERGALAVASPHSNSILLVGSSDEIKDLKALLAKMDVDAESGKGRLNAVFLKYISAEEAAKSIASLIEKSASKNPNIQNRRVAIEASPENNALLVDASPGDFDVVRKLVEQLDRMPEQVHIDVTIVEHSASDDLNFGVEMAALDLNSSPNSPGIAGSSTLNDQNASLFNIVQKGVFPQGLAIGVVAGTRTSADGSVVPNVPALININATKKQGKFKVLSHTSLESQDNKEASVNIVNQIPILKSTIEGGSGTSRDVIQNIERIDVGIKLKLKPHIIPGGDVRMTLNPSIEAVTDQGPSGTSFTPTIARREVSTTVTVGDGKTIVIAGLTRQDENRVDRRVPVLGAIPLLGRLFRQTVDTKENTNLLILVTPHVIADAGASARITEEWSRRTGLDANDER